MSNNRPTYTSSMRGIRSSTASVPSTWQSFAHWWKTDVRWILQARSNLAVPGGVTNLSSTRWLLISLSVLRACDYLSLTAWCPSCSRTWTSLEGYWYRTSRVVPSPPRRFLTRRQRRCHQGTQTVVLTLSIESEQKPGSCTDQHSRGVTSEEPPAHLLHLSELSAPLPSRRPRNTWMNCRRTACWKKWAFLHPPNPSVPGTSRSEKWDRKLPHRPLRGSWLCHPIRERLHNVSLTLSVCSDGKDALKWMRRTLNLGAKLMHQRADNQFSIHFSQDDVSDSIVRLLKDCHTSQLSPMTSHHLAHFVAASANNSVQIGLSNRSFRGSAVESNVLQLLFYTQSSSSWKPARHQCQKERTTSSSQSVCSSITKENVTFFWTTTSTFSHLQMRMHPLLTSDGR